MYEKRCGKRWGFFGWFLSDWANIHKTARVLSRVREACITVKFYSEISCSDFNGNDELLVYIYAKKKQSSEPTNIMKYTKNLKIIFSLLFILEFNTRGPKISNITYTHNISFLPYRKHSVLLLQRTAQAV